jgi:long-subunit acyl-CoA synthetase (AMP-forming)
MSIEAKYLPLQSAYRWETETPDRVYMIQPVGGGAVKEYTWSETLDQARRMAAHLRSLDLPAGSSIAIISKNCAHFILADLAIWMAGHVTVALFPTLDAETTAYVLEHSEAKLVFVGKLDTWDEMKRGVPPELPAIAFPLAPPTDYPKWDDVVAANEPIADSPTRAPEETALLVYTSGSTGTPKGVISTFGNMGTAARGIRQTFGMRSDDRQLSYLPLAHSFERAAVENLSLQGGSQVFFAESLDTFLDDLRRARPTVFHSVPRLWLKFQLGVLSKMPQKKLDRLLKIPIVSGLVRRKILDNLGLGAARMAISGSAPIPPELITWYRDLGLELLEGYAMTENFAYSHINLPGKTRAGYVGNCLPGVECKISEEGEVLVKSEATMPGYYKAPELTAACFTDDGFLKTGDRGELDEQGRLKITGRVKELFKTSKGKYIAPVPIENLLNADRHIEQSCVSGVGHPQPYATVLLSEDQRAVTRDPASRERITTALEALLLKINERVAGYERLQFIAVAKDPWLIENGFLTPTMKIKRRALEETYGPHLDTWYSAQKPVVWEE